MRELRVWSALCVALGGSLALAAREIASRGRIPAYEQPAFGIARLEGNARAAAGLDAGLVPGARRTAGRRPP